MYARDIAKAFALISWVEVLKFGETNAGKYGIIVVGNGIVEVSIIVVVVGIVVVGIDKVKDSMAEVVSKLLVCVGIVGLVYVGVRIQDIDIKVNIGEGKSCKVG